MEHWTGSAASRVFPRLGLAMLVAGLVAFARRLPWMGFTFVAAGGALVVLTEVRATVDEDGLLVRAGRLPWPVVRIPLADIESVEVIDVHPMRWGGWGYRGSLRLFRRAAWVVRAGPGMEVELTHGRRFVVTVDDAGSGAAALQALLTPRR